MMLLRIITILTILLSTSYSYACDCLESPMDVSYTKATLVFYGEVAEAGPTKKTTFKVSKWFKPRNKADNAVTLEPGTTNCDLFFREGDKWLIFASGDPLRASQCNGSELLEQKIQNK